MAKRFIKIYGQGVVGSGAKIYVDQENLFVWSGGGGGLMALLDRDGKPVITPINDEE